MAKKSGLSRREAAKAAVATVAGALAAASTAGEAQKDEKPGGAAPGVDSRIAEIEKSRGKPLSEEQRKAVMENIKSTEEGWTKGREFLVPDGTEPDFLFRPTALNGKKGRARG